MAEPNQDFITYSGDDIVPIFTVLDTAGAVVDISTVSGITWSARRNLDNSVVLTKTKAAGQIAFVTDGKDGKFQVTITATDTALLTGFYLHTASIADSVGAITTVTVGRMQVGQAPQWSYDPGAIATSDLYKVRFLVGDTLAGDQQLTDPEIQFCVDSYTNVYLAAAEVARNLAAKYARQVNLVQGELQTNYSDRKKHYSELAKDLEARGSARGGVVLGIWAGGISVQDKIAQQQDPDRVRPQFQLRMWDNYLVPLPPIADPENEQTSMGTGVPS